MKTVYLVKVASNEICFRGKFSLYLYRNILNEIVLLSNLAQKNLTKETKP